MIRRAVAALVLGFALLPVMAAAAPRHPGVVFDGSNAATSKASIHAMQAGRSQQQVGEFLVAMLRIQLEDVRSGYELKADDGRLEPAAFGRKVDGLTREQILERADRSPTKAAIPAGG